MSRIVYLLRKEQEYEALFQSIDFEVKIFNPEDVNSLNKHTLVCFTGGVDISPKFYSESPHPKTYSGDEKRDTREYTLAKLLSYRRVPLVGICRGAQLLCAVAGGTLYQHVDNHSGQNMIMINDKEYSGNKRVDALEDHHQMMNPDSVEKTGGKILGISGRFEASTVESTDQLGYIKYHSPSVNPEIAYWKDKYILAHQPHPEWGLGSFHHYVDYFKFTVDRLLKNASETPSEAL